MFEAFGFAHFGLLLLRLLRLRFEFASGFPFASGFMLSLHLIAAFVLNTGFAEAS